MEDTHGFYVGEGGGAPIRMSHPLPPEMRKQLDKGELVRVPDPDPEAPVPDPDPEAPDPEDADGQEQTHPPLDALKAAWVDYAVEVHKVPRAEAERTTRADLIERFGPK